MKIVTDTSLETKSSFLSLEKDFLIIVKKMLTNESLKKMLYYQTNNCLDRECLTQEQTMSLINNNIKIVPKDLAQCDERSTIIIGFDHFVPNSTNPEFRDNILTFSILCPYEQWNLGDFKLRPYKIAGEIDGLFEKQKLTGIGTTHLISAENILLDDKIGGVELVYSVIHGTDDKIE